MSTKNRITTRVSGATPIPSNCHDRNQILRRLMYLTGKAMGEKRSKEQNVTATAQTKPLTSPEEEIALRNQSPHVCTSKENAVIHIKFRVN